MRGHALIPLALLAALSIAAPAHGAFQPPTSVGPTAESIRNPTFAFLGGGSPLASATYSDFIGRTASDFVLAPPRPRPLRARLLSPPAAYGVARVAYLRTTSPVRPAGRFATVGVSLGSRSALGRLRILSRRAVGDTVYGGRTALAANRRGDVAAAWQERHGSGEHLMLAVRRPGGRIGNPSALVGSGLISSITLAFGERGDLVVAFQRSLPGRGRRVMARVRPAGGRFGPLEDIGPSDGISLIDAAVARDGSAVVAYGTQDGGEEAGKPWVVRAAVRRAESRFRAAQVLDPGDAAERPAGTVAAGIADDGTATVAWSGITGPRLGRAYPARVAVAPTGAGFGQAQALAGNAAVTDVAVHGGGDAIVVWGALTEVGNNQYSEQVFANFKPARASAFGAAEAVSPRERAGFARAAFNPRTARVSVLWVGQPGSPPRGQQPFALPEVLRYAARLP